MLFPYRFSHIHCRSCIVGLIERIGKAYKGSRRQNDFVSDLIKLDTPNLLHMQSPKEDDPRVDQTFIDMVRTFIQKNGLREVILSQVPAIMVSNLKVVLFGFWSFCLFSYQNL